MLFMVTMTHTAESCPGNDPQKLKEAIEALEKFPFHKTLCLLQWDTYTI